MTATPTRRRQQRPKASPTCSLCGGGTAAPSFVLQLVEESLTACTRQHLDVLTSVRTQTACLHSPCRRPSRIGSVYCGTGCRDADRDTVRSSCGVVMTGAGTVERSAAQSRLDVLRLAGTEW